MSSKRTYRKASGISDEERGDIVTHLKLQGWPEEKGALQKIALHYNIWPQTIKRWATGESNPPPNKVVVKKKDDIVRALFRELGLIFVSLDGARCDASYRDLITGVGIAVDKIQLLSGEPTDRHEFSLGDNRTTVLERVKTLPATSITASTNGVHK